MIKYDSETKLFWSNLNKIMNERTRNKNDLLYCMHGNNPEQIINNTHEIANKFNEYFINVGRDCG